MSLVRPSIRSPLPLLLLGGLLLSAPARADHDGARYEPRHGSPSVRHTEYAEVIASRPLYRSVRVNRPRESCYEVPVQRVRQDYWMDNGTAGAFAGAIAGGVVGHQFGKGRGKDAATALGAIIGAGIGQRAAIERSAPVYDEVATRYETRCERVRETVYEDRIEGYEVTYRYHGRTYTTHLPYDPGARLVVDVDVRPVRDGGWGR